MALLYTMNDEWEGPSDGEEDKDYGSYALGPSSRQMYGQRGQFTLVPQLTTKIAPMFDGSESWFVYEEKIDDWLDTTELTPRRHGPSLKNRLEGPAAIFKRLMDRDQLKDPVKGVASFKDCLRPKFLKGTQSIFLWRIFHLFRLKRDKDSLSKWIARFELLQKRLFESWMDLFTDYLTCLLYTLTLPTNREV